MTRAQAVAALREQLGESMKKFGGRFGVSDATVAHWEDEKRGIHRLYLEKIVALARRRRSTDGDVLAALERELDQANEGATQP